MSNSNPSLVYSFASSSSLELPVSVKINTLEGLHEPLRHSTLLRQPELRYRGSNQSPHSELYVTAQLWADSKPLTVAVQTPYKVFKHARRWDEWLTLPIDYSTIPLSAQLAITVWDLSPVGSDEWSSHAIPFGGTTIPLYDRDNTLQKGRQRCRLHLDRVADGLSETTTPYQLRQDRRTRANSHGGVITHRYEQDSEMGRLEALVKKHEMNEIPENKWLDHLVFRQIEKLQRSSFKQARNFQSPDSDEKDKGGEKDLFYLYIEFPRFDHPVVFTDHEYPAPPIAGVGSGSLPSHKPPVEVSVGPGIDSGDAGDPAIGRMVRIYDPEVGTRDNPPESKHRRLVRSHRTGLLDRDLRPNAKIRDELNMIMSYGPTQELNAEEKDLVWKFRHHLTRDKRALTKFVKSVSWTDANESKQAVQILPRWTEIDVDDALELLGSTFDNPAVRAYAVDRLRKSDDEDLLVYLLQLVQALKFEPLAQPTEDGSEPQDSSLASFLVSRAANNFVLGNYLHWYLMVECDDRSPEQEQEHRRLFAKVEYEFMTQLMKHPQGQATRKILLRQGELVAVLSKLSKDIRNSREDRIRKVETLKKFLADPKNDMVQIDPPLPLPLDPTVSVVGCYPEDSSVFKSSLLPLYINFKTSDGRQYPILFKTGDDLRQDQLVIQIITLMDRLLQKENLDLKLSPYRILATATVAGAVQFVPSMTLSNVVTRHRSILAYLRANNPDDRAPLGVRPLAMDTYVKSCAGYCVITYILGVGDRHLDNLLLAPTGHFFHADFGYILGRDPKPFAPLMKLPREMVDGMGGAQHQYYQQFLQHCFTAYTTLRKSANLILNLFALMSEANIPDIRIEPDKAVLKIQERFHLELTEEEAIRHFDALIQDSVNAFMPVVIDRLHGLVQNWRA
ncbi:putative phosphoinositide 3-kinase [Eremomyces bilateralis CBS 781.70]|uniref:Phosphatidylinositol 3-kinase VPS34 n=1 Tax=Eremomyces bilateralis CBS 781.70 TaxID=1392243 RepID=A0A6G1FS23_9PEZI|nr:putative phosphoinositide 3-kinase [Eremomyces bilateralis CBS 781.70]KAF1808536.1 putative phosphoinositide 3-kinase [Eremomyces bilateralis CBS 781.70]